MDYLSTRWQRIWEAMESCRSGSDDVSDPQFVDLATELAENPQLRRQFDRVQQADGAMKAAFCNVLVPAGLADQISRRLAEAARPTNPRSGEATSDLLAAPSLTAAVATTSDSPAPLRKQAERFSRRRLLAGFTALAAAVALLAAVWYETHLPQRAMTRDSVLADAMIFFGKDNGVHAAGELASRVAPPVGFQISLDIRPMPDIRWRHVENFLGGPAVAYDLPPIGGSRATLFVVERTVADLPSFPPSTPQSGTGGMSAAAWQAGNLLYVLVVDGDAGTYPSYLDQSHGPLT